MPKKWTRSERKEHLKDRFKHRREKIFSILFVAIVFIVMLSFLMYGISVQADPFLLVVLGIIIIILVPISIFFMDVLHWEV